MSRGVRRYRVLLVSSSGGVLLDVLGLRPWWLEHDRCWAAVRAPDTESLLRGERVHWCREQHAGHPFGLVGAVMRAVRLLRLERPDVIVSAGTGVAVAFFVAGRVLGIPTVWIETMNITGRGGLAARICARLAAAVLVQRRSLLARRCGSVYIGELY